MNISIKDVLQRIKPFFVLYLVLLCGCFVVKLLYSKDDIYFAVNTRHTDFLDTIEPYITNLGNGWTIVIIAGVLALYNYRIAFLMLTTFLLTSLAVQIAKFCFDAPRPKLYFKDQLSKLHFVKGVDILSHNSFPSGHTLTAFATGVLVTYLAKNKNWAYLLVFYGVMVGFSRMYLSEHFFEDVMAGSVMGVFLAICWIRWIDSRKFINSPAWNRGLLSPKSEV
ncbi:phosphatase PAP2 family protein [Mucilaginibacter gotjawali]|uniref:Membrane-associated phospholipid phosphatase n=2 Tax=Mucilaginibacter gotjawali TaxID=1550579 RepID=A0A839SCX3_9SPHI|nr:phosphatase PAP2 family protein [Mucilaginibacter gotjawali]MBB3055636.1 membrane-associated phospholipid phosphatase [Mucilaginibacter gotjawali]BAU53079.1 Undecaprenyl-diphosphatase BcrC [Mucilaginibacter gotjawali]